MAETEKKTKEEDSKDKEAEKDSPASKEESKKTAPKEEEKKSDKDDEKDKSSSEESSNKEETSKKEENKEDSSSEDKKEESDEKDSSEASESADESDDEESSSDGKPQVFSSNSEEDENASEDSSKKKKRFSFSFLKKDKKKSPQKESKADPIDPEDAINSLDESVKVMSHSKAEALAEQIDKHISHAEEKDYFVLRIQKKRALIVMGALVGIMWVLPAVRAVELLFLDGNSLFSDKAPTTEIDNQDEEDSVKIRIKNSSGDPSLGENLAEKLTESQYDFVELVEDEASMSGVQIITSQESSYLYEALARLLQEDFTLSTPSAELSVDSDFDAVILLGSN